MVFALDALPSSREAAVTFYWAAIEQGFREQGSLGVRNAKRALARGDLFYLLTAVLNRRDVDHDWLFARCREVQAAPDGYLDLWAREHYKSTIITYGLSIQTVLLDPEVTIGLFSHTRPIAKAFLKQIKLELENNEALKALFPDVLWAHPHRDAPKWSEDEGITVRRVGNPKEQTIEAWGLVEGMPTSKHFQVLLYDDVLDVRNVTTPEMIKKTTDAWAHSLALGVRGGRVRYVGTRYHFNDTYAEMMRRGAAIPRIHPATDTGKEDGKPVFMTASELRERRTRWGLYIYGAQMLQDPTADKLQGFRPEWLQDHLIDIDADKAKGSMNFYILIDPANEKKKESDYTAMVVFGLGGDENYYVVDAIRDRLGLKERADALLSLHRRWRPLAVGYERYGLQCDVEYLKIRMAEENYRFDITELGGPMAKHDRIRRLVPLFEAGRVYIQAHLRKKDYEGNLVDVTTAFVEEEYKPFPVGNHEDLFDAMARIVDEDLSLIWPRLEDDDRYARPRRRPRGATAWSA